MGSLFKNRNPFEKNLSFSYKMKELINQRDAEGRLHGVWEDYYSNGTLSWRVHWHHGKQHGVWEWYWDNGTLGGRKHWHHGEQKGLDIQWDYQGRITDKAYHLVIR
jgi:antitoxin component YwqK of YwqJK toxin-antitoxin module